MLSSTHEVLWIYHGEKALHVWYYGSLQQFGTTLAQLLCSYTHREQGRLNNPVLLLVGTDRAQGSQKAGK